MKLRKSSVHRLQFDTSHYKSVRSHRGDFVTMRSGGGIVRPPWMHSGSMTGAGRPSGKGRFGKRATATCQDYERNTNDNSNDSGFECDWNSQSESQFAWHTNTDKLIHQQKYNSLPKLSRSSYVKVNGEQGGKRSEIHTELMKNIYLPMKKSPEEISTDNGLPLHLLAKGTMSPDSTIHSPTASLTGGSQEGRSMSSSPVSSDGNSTSIPSPVPIKRPRFCFPSNQQTKATGLKLRNQNGIPVRGSVGKRLPAGTTPTLTSNLSSVSRDGRVHLQILAQPEEQHRARYQTEGSRGAIKDRKLNGFPTVKLCGYDKPATLQIFIGTDQGKVSPHMFYQACKVTGKSSTPCIEKKVEGTVLIEIEFEPSKDMVISCDCVGILKERNVDVEQRFPFHHAAQSRKKSTKCRMIFRTTIMNAMGVEETLQVPSVPILCTQPPGQPEICKQSIAECPSSGGKELFIIGKNFLKDTKIVISEENNHGEIIWEAKSSPLKDFVAQTHLICVIPAYKDENISTPVDCKLSVWSGGRLSEPHRFTYFPNISAAAHMGLVNSTSVPDSTPLTLTQSSMGHTLSQCQQVVPVEIQEIHTMQSSTATTVMSPTTVETSMVSPTTSSGLSPVCHQLTSAVIGSPTALSNQTVTCSSTIEPTLMDHLPGSQPHTTTTLGQLTPLTFDSNMIATTQQERLVVNELQSLLEQSAAHQQQQQQCQAATDATMSDIKPEVLLSSVTSMDIKPSPTFTTLSPNMSASVVEMSYPTETTSIADISTGTTFQALNVPFESSLMSSVQPQCVLTTPSVPTIDMNAMVVCNQQQQPQQQQQQQLQQQQLQQQQQQLQQQQLQQQQQQQLQQQQQQQLQQQHQIMPLLPSSCAAPVPLGSPGRHLAQNTSNMGCATILKNEQQATQVCQTSEVQVATGTGTVVFINGELQGPIANALTQMSDNELINYINPSCFDQGSF